ncbi:hypothetical protein B0J14DRAFT_592890 [Halenospora varia]|nr:hypothetical protein B0J14DRAFT_592890 [Halenospora varia]
MLPHSNPYTEVPYHRNNTRIPMLAQPPCTQRSQSTDQLSTASLVHPPRSEPLPLVSTPCSITFLLPSPAPLPTAILIFPKSALCFYLPRITHLEPGTPSTPPTLHMSNSVRVPGIRTREPRTSSSPPLLKKTATPVALPSQTSPLPHPAPPLSPPYIPPPKVELPVSPYSHIPIWIPTSPGTTLLYIIPQFQHLRGRHSLVLLAPMHVHSPHGGNAPPAITLNLPRCCLHHACTQDFLIEGGHWRYKSMRTMVTQESKTRVAQ